MPLFHIQNFASQRMVIPMRYNVVNAIVSWYIMLTYFLRGVMVGNI